MESRPGTGINTGYGYQHRVRVSRPGMGIKTGYGYQDLALLGQLDEHCLLLVDGRVHIRVWVAPPPVQVVPRQIASARQPLT